MFDRALDIALNTPEENIELEFEYFNQEFHLKGRNESLSVLVSKNTILL